MADMASPKRQSFWGKTVENHGKLLENHGKLLENHGKLWDLCVFF